MGDSSDTKLKLEDAARAERSLPWKVGFWKSLNSTCYVLACRLNCRLSLIIHPVKCQDHTKRLVENQLNAHLKHPLTPTGKITMLWGLTVVPKIHFQTNLIASSQTVNGYNRNFQDLKCTNKRNDLITSCLK